MNKRRIYAVLAVLVIVLGAVIGVVALYLNSPEFNALAKQRVIEEIAGRTGAKVTLRSLSWSLWQRRFRIDDLTLRGLEPDYQAPLAHFTRIDVGLNLRTLLEHRADLFELTLTQPEFHVLITPDGKTNFPAPPQSASKPVEFQISIQNFNVLNGAAILNERRIDLDLSLQNLASRVDYDQARELVQTRLAYDGVVDRSPDVKLAIPYSLSADLDYTRGTLIVQRMQLSSGRNQAKLQGKVNQLLSADISGKLDYVGTFEIQFLNYFFEAERFAGKGAAAGSLEFARTYFLTQGKATSDAIDFEGWHTTNASGEYTYRYPDRMLTVRNLKNDFMSGSVSGEAIVENLPGPSRVSLDLKYTNIDAAGLARAYPWDPKYRIFSNATGTIKGWLEGKLTRFTFSGHAVLKSYRPPTLANVAALPVDGSTDYTVAPGMARIMNADGQFYSTSVKADGLIQEKSSDLRVDMRSSDFRDLAFLYADANGSGSFNGTIKGAIATPVLDGEFTIDNYSYQQRKIEHAAGGVHLDLMTELATLRGVRVRKGGSEALLNGSAAMSGSPVDLRIQSSRVLAQDVREDIRQYIDRDVDGIFAGDVHVTSLSPLRVEGDVSADNLIVDSHAIGNARGHVRYFEPSVELTQLSVRQGTSTLTGGVSFNRATEAVTFNARVNALNIETLHPLGIPEVIKGVIRQGEVQGDGTFTQPSLRGNATLQNLSVDSVTFAQARVEVASTTNKVDVNFDTGSNLNLRAEIDTAARGYPFTARANFTQYPLEQVVKLSEASVIATGNANLSGLLSDTSRVRGDGRIESADIRVQQTTLRPTKPFTFSFDPNELTVSDVTLSGQSTQVTLAGTIGLRDPAPLNVRVMGQVDLKLLEARYPDFMSAGVINVSVDIRGTLQNLDLRGNGVLANASLRRVGFFTGLTNVNGNLSFNQNQIRLNNIVGTAGGGTVRAEGTATLQGDTVQNMNIQIDTNSVRLRGYPEGLRTVVDTRLNLRGTLDAPLLEGNVQIQSLAYRSSFEDFLAMLSQENLGSGSSPLGNLRLSLHVEGGKNITIQNQLADVEARVEIDLKGTVNEPSVTGHIEASGGTLTFQGNRYTVTRGNIDFVDPLRIQPVIDIEAESQVRDYRVILSITGRGDNPKLAMRSDPPLPELEIVSLIAGGRSREEIASRSGSTVPTSEQLFQRGAASILFDLLQQRVGNRLGVLGSGRVRIDPFRVGAENTPGARITLSEQVTRDLSVTYSQDLASARQQVIMIEYFVSRNTSVVASRDEFGNFGLDIRHRTRIK